MGSNKVQYLEGVRGIAAFCVFLHHFFIIFYPAYHDGNASLSKLGGFELYFYHSPLSFLLNGNFMVCIFFILSGYVLSLKYWKSNKQEYLVQSAIKRFFRLYLPTAFSIVVSFLCLKYFAQHYTSLFEVSKSTYLNVDLQPHDLTLTYLLKALFFKVVLQKDVNINVALWTINVELLGSYILYAVLSLTHNAIQKSRVILIIIICGFLYYYSNLYFIAFFLGSFLNLISFETFKLKKVLVFLFLISGLMLGSVPSEFIESNIHSGLVRLILGKDEFLHIIGAFLLVLAIKEGRVVRSFLEKKLFIYFGKISFGLYLIHMVILYSVTAYSFKWLYGQQHLNYHVAMAITFVVSTVFLILFSDLITRWIDKPTIRFGNTFSKLFIK